MMRPTYQNLKAKTRWSSPVVLVCTGSSEPQGNPRFYKFYWRIFTLECPWEDSDFFQHAPVLCAADYQKEVKRLLQKRQSFLIYGFKRPRRDPKNPWDMTHAKWTNVEFAVSLDADTDPVVEGGHR